MRANLLELYPTPAECPECFYNLLRHRLRLEIPRGKFLPACPCCGAELFGF